jgi:O-antigen ligase
MSREIFHRNASKTILAGIFLFVFFSIRITNILIILYVVNWLAGCSLKTWSLQKRDWLVLLIISPWILEMISLLYSSNMKIGLHEVEKRLALLAIPFVTLHSGNIAVNNRTLVYQIAIASTVVATLYCLFVALYNVIFQNAKMAYWEYFTDPIIVDPGYAALLINILSIWIFGELVMHWKITTSRRKLLCLSLIGYFGIITFLLSSKLHGVLFIAIVLIGTFLIYRRNIVSWKVSVLVVIVIATIGVSLTKSEMIDRYSHIDNFVIPDFGAPDEEFNELTLRLAILKCAMFIIKDSPVFGTGVGDVMADLERVYRNVDFKFGYNNAYDPHNQYLRVCLATGLVGLALFLTSLFIVLTNALRSQEWVVVGFMVVLCFSFLFESVLNRHTGIIIYAFLHSVLVFGIDSNRSK